MAYKRKLYYAPGIISLIGFLFLLPYSYKKIKPDTLRVITLNVPVEEGKGEMLFSVYNIQKHLNRKKQITIFLNSDKETNEKKIELIRYEARKLKYTFDTSSAILITFSNGLPYSEFIKLLDVCKIDSIKRYAVWGNHFAIYGEFPFIEIKGNSMFVFGNDVVPVEPSKKTFKERIIATFKPYASFQAISLLLGWLILVFTFLYFKKKKVTFTMLSLIP
jgi:hypothetical protein